MLSVQTRYTPTASKVDNDKQIPQLLLIVLSRCSNIVVLQQTQESAVILRHAVQHVYSIQLSPPTIRVHRQIMLARLITLSDQIATTKQITLIK
ncbi:pentatricopeptide repeat-containing protein [Dorcoceras hygrometricum]|uniref:Pentatricopeptide repeat-containing protein n=1 Tax=Dorcoceras hygrometricum TaxID=472368 RepID=A0A2Z7DE86_9LAMI|nr:pentatricopeptide repeat-containing protein [Dorcoceras hygrometricum]